MFLDGCVVGASDFGNGGASVDGRWSSDVGLQLSYWFCASSVFHDGLVIGSSVAVVLLRYYSPTIDICRVSFFRCVIMLPLLSLFVAYLWGLVDNFLLFSLVICACRGLSVVMLGLIVVFAALYRIQYLRCGFLSDSLSLPVEPFAFSLYQCAYLFDF